MRASVRRDLKDEDSANGRCAREKFTQFYAALCRIATYSNRKLKNIRIVTEETL